MISDGSESYVSTDTEDISTVTDASSVDTGLRGRTKQLLGDGVPGLAHLQEEYSKEYSYSFMARCVVCPVSGQDLFRADLLLDRDKRVNCENLTEVSIKCKAMLDLKYPSPPPRSIPHWTMEPTEPYLRKKYLDPDPEYELEDFTLLWFHSQVSHSERVCGYQKNKTDSDKGYRSLAYRLLKDNEGQGRRNGYSLSCLKYIFKQYVEHHLGRKDHKLQRTEEVIRSVNGMAFNNVEFTTKPTRALTLDYYWDLLQKLLNVPAHRHKMIFNSNKLDNMETQIVRLRSEIDERDMAMVQGERRTSIQYVSEEDAVRAHEEQIANLKTFKENCQHLPSHRSSPHPSPHPSPHLPARKVRTISRNENLDRHSSMKVNEFKIKLSVWSVASQDGGLTKDTEYFCQVKCGGCRKSKVKRMYRQPDSTGQMVLFKSEFDFETSRPSPRLKIKLKENKDGLFVADEKCLAHLILNENIQSHNIPKWSNRFPMTSEHNHYTYTIDYKYEVEYSRAIKMLGWLTVSAKSGSWKKERKSFFILFKRNELESENHGLQEIDKHGDVVRSITTLTEYDVLRGITDTEDEKDQLGFTLLREGHEEEIYFYAETKSEKEYWVHQLFLLTKQTHETSDRTLTSASIDTPVEDGPLTEKVPGPAGLNIGRRWPTADITAMQGRHSKYFREITNSMVDLNMNIERPAANGQLHSAHEAILLEYKLRYEISNEQYATTMLEALTRKMCEGYYVDTDHLQKFIQKILESAHTVEGTKIKEDCTRQLFDYMQSALRFIFDKFPFDCENKLIGYSLLLKNLSRDLEEVDEIGHLDVFMLKMVEISISNEYQEHIAPSHLVKLGLEEYRAKEVPRELVEKTFHNLMRITIRLLMFTENFITFYSENLMRYYQHIDQNKIKELCETTFRLYEEDLLKLLQYIPACQQVFELFDLLNNFCKNTFYLAFGHFHRNTLDKAFRPPVLHHIEHESLGIDLEAQNNFSNETWIYEPIETDSSCRTEHTDLACGSTRLLNEQLESFRTWVDDREWPNPECRGVLTNMAQEKSQQLRIKYGTLLKNLAIKKVTTDKGILPGTLQIFNSILALYDNSVPAVLDHTNELDQVVLQAVQALSGPLVRYLHAVLSDWDGHVLTNLVACYLSGIDNRLSRVKEFVAIINKKVTWVCGELHQNFADTYSNETYKILLGEVTVWLEDLINKKRCYPAQIYVIRELVDKLGDHLDNEHSETYSNIDKLLKGEEVLLLISKKDNSAIQNRIKQAFIEPTETN